MADGSKINHLEGEKIRHFKSLSGFYYKRIYGQHDRFHKLPDAGEYPFNRRGIHNNMYRGRLWTRRQQSGFGSPEESNEIIKYLLSIGQTGINMDAYVATKLGLDPDYPFAQEDL
jgi:methylmalonyl-CoA mutase N-terminal domain/subunit